MLLSQPPTGTKEISHARLEHQLWLQWFRFRGVLVEIDLENLLVYSEIYGIATKYKLIKTQKVKSAFCF